MKRILTALSLAGILIVGCASLPASSSTSYVYADVFNSNWNATSVVFRCVEGSGPDFIVRGLIYNERTSVRRRLGACTAYTVTIRGGRSSYTFPIASQVSEDSSKICVIIGPTMNLTAVWNCTRNTYPS